VPGQKAPHFDPHRFVEIVGIEERIPVLGRRLERGGEEALDR
jgi:hypothetical protein